VFQATAVAPRTAPPAATLESEAERTRLPMAEIGYNGIEHESAIEFLRRGQPGETLTAFTKTSITTSAGRVCKRRDLRDMLVPGSATARGREAFYSQFPNPRSYEDMDQPAFVPPQVVRE
jgi:hypothetical protein